MNPNLDCARRLAAVLGEMSPRNAEDGIEKVLHAVFKHMCDDGLSPGEAVVFTFEFGAAVALAMRARQPTSETRH